MVKKNERSLRRQFELWNASPLNFSALCEESSLKTQVRQVSDRVQNGWMERIETRKRNELIKILFCFASVVLH